MTSIPRVVMNPALTGRPIVVSRPGFDATAALTTEQKSFDSSWVSINQIVYEGVASANASDYIDVMIGTIGGRYYKLASFASLGFVPLCLIMVSGSSAMPSWSSRFAAMTHTGLYIGYPYISDSGALFGAAVPSGTFHYMVMNIPVSQ